MRHVEAAEELRRGVREYEARFLALSEEQAGHSPEPGKWSRKKILGHLIDSAANNHQRFIRMQLTPELAFPNYGQTEWVRLNDYAARPWSELVALWAAYNRHLAHVMERIAPGTLSHAWESGSSRQDLQFVATDYVVHLRHHADQIVKTA